METKLIEIRDRGTKIVALATRMVPATPRESALLSWCGYGPATPLVVLAYADPDNGGRTECHHDPVEWRLHRGRTMQRAHLHLQDHWDDVEDGGVVDVEYVAGEVDAPKVAS